MYRVNNLNSYTLNTDLISFRLQKNNSNFTEFAVDVNEFTEEKK